MEPVIIDRVELTPVDSFIVMSALTVFAGILENFPESVLMRERAESLCRFFEKPLGEIPLTELMSLMDVVRDTVAKFSTTKEEENDGQPGNNDAA